MFVNKCINKKSVTCQSNGIELRPFFFQLSVCKARTADDFMKFGKAIKLFLLDDSVGNL